VANTPFKELPTARFLRHLILPCAFLLGVGYLCVGVVANTPYFQEASGPTTVPTFLESSINVYQLTISRLSNLPAFCVYDEKVNEFQQSQCSHYWDDLLRTGGLALSPFFLVLLVIFLNLEIMKSFYSHMNKKVEKEKANFSGKVTHPPEAPGDFFSQYYCLQPVTVEIANKTQIKVYLSSMLPVPMAGQTLALFDDGEHFGKKRYLAVVYAPHIAVVKGA
jgi:hypothetical protein